MDTMDDFSAPLRLQKFLARAGVCSRREGEHYIRAGRVAVNGVVVTEMGTKVDPATDRVQGDGRSVRLKEPAVYILLNKPPGYISSCRHGDRKIVIDLVDVPQRVFPVGRLDKDSTGLLLLTNDGRLHHRLAHPSFDHEKKYIVTVGRPISDSALDRMAAGILLNGKKTRPAAIRKLSDKKFSIVLMEGRNRQIRRMVSEMGHKVIGLHRVRMACIELGNLPSGKWRHLSANEVNDLLAYCGRNASETPES